MTRDISLSLFLLICLASTNPLAAQQTEKLPVIGLLRSTTVVDAARNNDAFLRGLRDLGYIEGKNILIKYRYAMGQTDRLHDLAAELVGQKVDVIVTGGGKAISAAMQATKFIPIVAGYSGDLVAAGAVNSLSEPGGNVTGMTNISRDLAAKRLQLFAEMVPTSSRIVMLTPSGPTGWGVSSKVRATLNASRQFGVNLHSVALDDPAQFKSAFTRIIKNGTKAVVIVQSPFTNAHAKTILELTSRYGLLSMCESGRWTVKGCLISYGPNVRYMFRRAAAYVDKILKGRKPSDLPIEQTTKYEMVVNLKTAKALKISLPRSILLRADNVIQ